MPNIGNMIDKLLRNHIYKIIIIHWISYQPFEQPAPDQLLTAMRNGQHTYQQILKNNGGLCPVKLKTSFDKRLPPEWI